VLLQWILNLYECAERSAGGRVHRWMVVSRGNWADDNRLCCGKQELMSPTDERAFEGIGHDPAT